MSDLLAKEQFTPAVLAEAFECGNATAPLFIGPWTFIAKGLECQKFDVEARLETPSVALATRTRINRTAKKHDSPVQACARVHPHHELRGRPPPPGQSGRGQIHGHSVR